MSLLMEVRRCFCLATTPDLSLEWSERCCRILPKAQPEGIGSSRLSGRWENHYPSVDEETLSRYYKYLSARLSFPFTAHYPEPRSSLEEVQHRCTVVELLDPVNDICDEFDGIFCKTRKGKYEVNLPLTELEIPDDSPNFQFIEDYWYWFWNWR